MTNSFDTFERQDIKFEWSNCGRILAVGGYTDQPDGAKEATGSKLTEIENFVHFYDTNGKLIYKLKIPSTVIAKSAFEPE